MVAADLPGNNPVGQFITALFINGLIELIDRLVIGLNELILTLTFYDFTILYLESFFV